MFHLLRFDSFFSIWYWVLLIVVWTAVCHRTMGVPHDMLLRARRLPDVAARVEILARIAADRRAGIARAAGMPMAAAAGFGLTVLAGLGYGQGVEPAKAAFVLLAPLAMVVLRDLRLARLIHGGQLGGADLLRRLARRRLSTQGLGVLALIAAALSALAHPPGQAWY